MSDLLAVCTHHHSHTEDASNGREYWYSSRQRRLLELASGDTLWLVTYSRKDKYCYLTERIVAVKVSLNTPEDTDYRYGLYRVDADNMRSARYKVGQKPVDGVLRQLTFDPPNPIGARPGPLTMYLQAMRRLSRLDSRLLKQFADG